MPIITNFLAFFPWNFSLLDPDPDPEGKMNADPDTDLQPCRWAKWIVFGLLALYLPTLGPARRSGINPPPYRQHDDVRTCWFNSQRIGTRCPQCGGSRKFFMRIRIPLFKLMRIRIQILLLGWGIFFLQIFNFCFQSLPKLVICNFLSKNAGGRVRGEG